MPSQNVSLTSELSGYVSSLVDQGQYASVSEVHRDAIRNLKQKNEKERQYREHIDLLLEEGRRDFEQGRYTEFSSEEDFEKFFDEIEQDVELEIASENA